MRSRCFAAALLLFVTVLSGCNAQPQLAELNIRSLSDDSSTFEYSDTDSEITVFSETPETFLPVPTEDTTVLVTDGRICTRCRCYGLNTSIRRFRYGI